MATKILKDGTTVTTKTVYETGHGRNLANFSTFLKPIRVMGARYQPSNELITRLALDDKEVRVTESLENCARQKREADNAEIERNKVYENLRSYTTRLLATLASSTGITDLMRKDAAGIGKKIQGARAAKKEAPDASRPESEQKRYISASQQSFDAKLDHFRNLRVLLESAPGYKPNEKDLSIDGVREYEQALRASNDKVAEADNALIDARNNRNAELYHETTGVVAISRLMKAYLRGIMGTGDPEYKKISALRFRAISDKASALT